MPVLPELPEALVRALAQEHIRAAGTSKTAQAKTAQMQRLYLLWFYGDANLSLRPQASPQRIEKVTGIPKTTVDRELREAKAQMEPHLGQAKRESAILSMLRYDNTTPENSNQVFKIPAPDRARDDAFTDTTLKAASQREQNRRREESA